MTAEEKGPEEHAEGEPQGGEKRSAKEKVGDGFKEGMGMLSAFKDALEETIQEARERGDLSAEKAKEVVKDALDKAQAAGERARDKLDFAHQAELETVRGAMDSIRKRVSDLEESVFGGARGGGEAAADDGEEEDA